MLDFENSIIGSSVHRYLNQSSNSNSNSSSLLLDDDYYDYGNINYYDNSSNSSSNSTSPTSIEDEQQEQEQDQYQQEQHYTTHEQIILSWTARIAGIISFISGLYILCMAYKRRDHVYHRLMLGLSIHILLWSPWHIIGSLAVPKGTPETWGAYGTTQTCTAQGFFFQLSMCIPLYYVFLSCYSWVVIVYGNFDPKKYQWIEKYIHLIVHIFPIASSIYLLIIEAFNSTGLGQCWIASIPFGCGDYGDLGDYGDDSTIVVCERGPEDITKKLVYFAGIPAIFYLLFPTTMMGSLCIVVWNKHKQLKKQTQTNVKQTKQKQKPQLQRNNTTRTTATSAAALSSVTLSAATLTGTSPNTTVVQPQQQQQQQHQPLISLSMVITQSLVYVGVLYWIFIPQFIVSLISVIGNRKVFGFNLFSCIVTDCLGLWIALMYWYFSTNAAASSIVISFNNIKHKCTPHQHHFNNNTNKTTTATTVMCVHCGDMGDPSTLNINQEDYDNDDEENNNNEHDDDDDDENETSKPFSIRSNKSNSGNGNNKQQKHQKMKPRYSFNIFDGTAPANGRFSDFVFDGDDEDESNDEKESEYWAGCQNG